MADAKNVDQESSQQQVGQVFILYGTVKAVSQDGFERVLNPNSPVFANERIVTGPDGSLTIVFTDGQSQLDLGRLSEITLDSDVYSGIDSADVDDLVAQVEDIQQALQDETYDPTAELPAPAAGDTQAGDGGGGRYIWESQAVGMEVTPDSGAETIGIANDFLDPPPVDILEQETVELVPEASVVPVGDESPPPPEDTPPGDIPPGDEPINLVPLAEPDVNTVTELSGGTIVDGVHSVTGNILDNDTDGDIPTILFSVTINGETIEMPPGGSVTRLTDLGAELTINSDGSYTYTILTDILHETNGQGDGVEDFEQFSYTIVDGNGDTAASTLTVNILDTVPVAHPDANIITENGFNGDSGGLNQVQGNVIFGWDDGMLVSGAEDQQSGDQGLHVVDVQGDFADGVTFALNTSLETAQGGTIIFSSDGSYVYTAPSGVDNPLDENGVNQAVPERFEYTVEDADGSPSSTVLTINIEDTAPVALDDSARVEEGDQSPEIGANNQISGNVISAGNNGPNADGSGSVNDQQDQDSADGNASLVGVSGDFAAGVTFSLDTDLATAQGGIINFSSDGSYTYIAPDRVDHGDDVPDAEQFTYTIADGDGSEANAALTITIADTGPLAINDSATVEEGDRTFGDGVNNQVSGNVITAGHNENDFTDGNRVSDQPDFDSVDGNTTLVSVVVDGVEYSSGSFGTAIDTALGGSINFSGDGSYTYTAPDAVNHGDLVADSETFSYTIEDGDGSQSSADLTVSITDTAPSTSDVEGISVFFRAETAGFDNVVGVYEVGDNGEPINPHIIVRSTDEYLNHPDDELVFSSTDSEVKLFLIANGANRLPGNVLDAAGNIDDSLLQFAPGGRTGSYVLQYQNSAGAWVDYTGSSSYGTYFMDEAFNVDDLGHIAVISETRSYGQDRQALVPPDEYLTNAIVFPDGSSGQIQYIGIEDLMGGGDLDYDDATLFGASNLGVYEAGLPGGAFAGTEVTTVGGNFFTDGNISVSADNPVTVRIDGQDITLSAVTVTGSDVDPDAQPDAGGPPSMNIVTDSGQNLRIDNNGDWQYTLVERADHDVDSDDDGIGDPIVEAFELQVIDSDGSVAPEPIHLEVTIYDDGVQASDVENGAPIALSDTGGQSASPDVVPDDSGDAAPAPKGSPEDQDQDSDDDDDDEDMDSPDDAGNVEDDPAVTEPATEASEGEEELPDGTEDASAGDGEEESPGEIDTGGQDDDTESEPDEDAGESQEEEPEPPAEPPAEEEQDGNDDDDGDADAPEIVDVGDSGDDLEQLIDPGVSQ